MTIGAIVNAVGMLGLVLALLLFALRILKRYAPSSTGAGARVPLEVVQRLPLGPRQGIAVIRIGEQMVAVSVGEGGVRPILELDLTAAEQPDTAVPPATVGRIAPAPARAFAPAALRKLVQSAFRSTVPFALLVALTLASGAARPADAQGAEPPTPPALAATPQATATRPKVKRPAPRDASSGAARADTMISRLAPRLDLALGNDKAGGLRLSGTVGIVVMMGLLTLIPTLVLLMTGFTRILIVLHFLRQAIGAQSAPPAQLVAALALLITGFVMAPTLRDVNANALEPWMDGKMPQTQMLAEAAKPFREFMIRQTREKDIGAYMAMSQLPAVARVEDVPLVVLMSAFVTSELRIAFQIGFVLFLPFIVIDVVVASVLMSMGMMMVPPAMISLPFKLLLFVLVDGWTLVVQGLVQSFH